MNYKEIEMIHGFENLLNDEELLSHLEMKGRALVPQSVPQTFDNVTEYQLNLKNLHKEKNKTFESVMVENGRWLQSRKFRIFHMKRPQNNETTLCHWCKQEILGDIIQKNIEMTRAPVLEDDTHISWKVNVMVCSEMCLCKIAKSRVFQKLRFNYSHVRNSKKGDFDRFPDMMKNMIFQCLESMRHNCRVANYAFNLNSINIYTYLEPAQTYPRHGIRNEVMKYVSVESTALPSHVFPDMDKREPSDYAILKYITDEIIQNVIRSNPLQDRERTWRDRRI